MRRTRPPRDDGAGTHGQDYSNTAMGDHAWECVTAAAAFPGMDGAAALVFKNKMWLLGGWNPRGKVNFPGPPHGPKDVNSRVYSSENGAEWVVVNKEAPWEGRHTAGAVVHDGRMWILGGDCIQRHYQPDVWSTTDGVNLPTVCLSLTIRCGWWRATMAITGRLNLIRGAFGRASGTSVHARRVCEHYVLVSWRVLID